MPTWLWIVIVVIVVLAVLGYLWPGTPLSVVGESSGVRLAPAVNRAC